MSIRTIFSHRRSEQFCEQNTIFLMFSGFIWPLQMVILGMFLPMQYTMLAYTKIISKRVPKLHILSSINTDYCTRAIIFTPFFSAVYNQERLILQTNLCTKQGNMGLKSAVYNQERVIIVHALYILWQPQWVLAV